MLTIEQTLNILHITISEFLRDEAKDEKEEKGAAAEKKNDKFCVELKNILVSIMHLQTMAIKLGCKDKIIDDSSADENAAKNPLVQLTRYMLIATVNNAIPNRTNFSVPTDAEIKFCAALQKNLALFIAANFPNLQAFRKHILELHDPNLYHHQPHFDTFLGQIVEIVEFESPEYIHIMKAFFDAVQEHEAKFAEAQNAEDERPDTEHLDLFLRESKGVQEAHRKLASALNSDSESKKELNSLSSAMNNWLKEMLASFNFAEIAEQTVIDKDQPIYVKFSDFLNGSKKTSTAANLNLKAIFASMHAGGFSEPVGTNKIKILAQYSNAEFNNGCLFVMWGSVNFTSLPFTFVLLKPNAEAINPLDFLGANGPAYFQKCLANNKIIPIENMSLSRLWINYKTGMNIFLNISPYINFAAQEAQAFICREIIHHFSPYLINGNAAQREYVAQVLFACFAELLPPRPIDAAAVIIAFLRANSTHTLKYSILPQPGLFWDMAALMGHNLTKMRPVVSDFLHAGRIASFAGTRFVRAVTETTVVVAAAATSGSPVLRRPGLPAPEQAQNGANPHPKENAAVQHPADQTEQKIVPAPSPQGPT